MKIGLVVILLLGSMLCYVAWIFYLERLSRLKQVKQATPPLVIPCPPHSWKEITQGTNWRLECDKCKQKAGQVSNE